MITTDAEFNILIHSFTLESVSLLVTERLSSDSARPVLTISLRYLLGLHTSWGWEWEPGVGPGQLHQWPVWPGGLVTIEETRDYAGISSLGQGTQRCPAGPQWGLKRRGDQICGLILWDIHKKLRCEEYSDVVADKRFGLLSSKP